MTGKTDRPIGDDPPPLDAMSLLSRVASRAMEDGADPSATVSPDHELLMLCDAMTMLSLRYSRTLAEWRDGRPMAHPDSRELSERARQERRDMAVPLRKLGKMRAVTPAGIFAKAAALRHVSREGTATLGASLADDILNSVELRRAIWPATKEGPVE